MTGVELIDVRRGSADKYRWLPFDSSDGYDRDDWWDSPPYHDDDPWFVQALRDADEVGRVKLVHRGKCGSASHTASTPQSKRSPSRFCSSRWHASIAANASGHRLCEHWLSAIPTED